MSKQDIRLPVIKLPVVKFTVTDGVLPTMEKNGSIALRSPLTMNIQSGLRMKIRMGLSCERPLHVFEASSAKSRGLSFSGSVTTFDSGEEIEIEFENTSKMLVLLERGDVIAKGTVLSSEGFLIA